MSHTWSTIPDPSIPVEPKKYERLGPGWHLTIISRITEKPVVISKDDKRFETVIFTFLEVTKNLEESVREASLFIEVDKNGQPVPNFKGYGRWCQLLDGLEIPRTVEEYPLGKLIFEPAKILVTEKGWIKSINKPNKNEEELCLAYCEKHALS